MVKRFGKAKTKHMENYAKLCVVKQVKRSRLVEFLNDYKLTKSDLVAKYGEEYYTENEAQLELYRKEFDE